MQVYKAIAAVSAELSGVGIAKQQKNVAQGFSFRGIDDVMNTLSPILAKHGLMMLPRVLERQVTERANARGGVLFSVCVEVEFDLVAAEDASRHTIRVVGEAMDSGDKATNKAMSAAYKYAAFQTFCVPLVGTEDADAQTHEVAQAIPPGYENWLDDMRMTAESGTDALLESWKLSPAPFKALAQGRDATTWASIKAAAAAVKHG